MIKVDDTVKHRPRITVGGMVTTEIPHEISGWIAGRAMLYTPPSASSAPIGGRIDWPSSDSTLILAITYLDRGLKNSWGRMGFVRVVPLLSGFKQEGLSGWGLGSQARREI